MNGMDNVNAAIARLLGWKMHLDDHYNSNKRIWWYYRNSKIGNSVLPDYGESWDAAASLREYVSEKQLKDEFIRQLTVVLRNSGCPADSYFDIMSAHPHFQRHAFYLLFQDELHKLYDKHEKEIRLAESKRIRSLFRRRRSTVQNR